MPKRSNFFQRLVFQIEQAMVDVTETKVTESVLMTDQRTGEAREIDVLIEAKVSGYSLRIAVECRNYRRKCDSTWIDQLIGKYEDLPVDKVVAVSRRGFTEPAKAKALQHGIVPLSLSEVSAADWDSVLTETGTTRGMSLGLTSWMSTGFRLSDPDQGQMNTVWHDESEAEGFRVTDLESGQSWRLPDFERDLTQNDELLNCMRSAQRRMLAELTEDRSQRSVSRSALLHKRVDYTLTDASGKVWPVDQVMVQFEVRVIHSRTEAYQYRGQRVSVSSFKTEGDILDDPTGWVTVQTEQVQGEGMVMVSRPVHDGEFQPINLRQLAQDIGRDSA